MKKFILALTLAHFAGITLVACMTEAEKAPDTETVVTCGDPAEEGQLDSTGHVFHPVACTKDPLK